MGGGYLVRSRVIGGACRGLQLLGFEVAAYVSCEIDPVAQRVTKHAWPGVIDWCCVRSVAGGHFKKLASDRPRISVILIVAGFPCSDLSGLSVMGTGRAGKNSSFFWSVWQVSGTAISTLPDVQIYWALEHVASMGSHGPAARGVDHSHRGQRASPHLGQRQQRQGEAKVLLVQLPLCAAHSEGRHSEGGPHLTRPQLYSRQGQQLFGEGHPAVARFRGFQVPDLRVRHPEGQASLHARWPQEVQGA